MKYQSLFGLMLLLLLACGGESTTETNTPESAEMEQETAAYQSMVTAHDRVMPRMGEIAEAQLRLRALKATEGIAERYEEKANTILSNLESIHDGMMEWMPAAMVTPSDLRESKSHEEIMAHYGRYDREMQRLESDLDSYLEVTDELLGLVATPQ